MSEADRNPPAKPDAGKRGGVSAAAVPPADNSLGAFLTAARERRGASRDEAIAQTRIPAHYIRMIESDNYNAISDQLYLLPFIRRYAEFLGLDPEETGIRFVREVQRAESNLTRMSEPIVDRRRARGRFRIWAVSALVLAIAAGLYLERHRLSLSSIPLGLQPAETIAPSSGGGSDANPGPPIAVPVSPPGAAKANPAPAQGGSMAQPPADGRVPQAAAP
jgi:helix-turn-helix protein